MSLKRAFLVLFSVSALTSVHAEVVFNDTFVAADGTLLDGRTPPTGSNWNVTEGASQLVINEGSVDTSNVSPGLTLAFGGFTQSLSAGKILTLTFNTLEPASGNFATLGWAGVSLYTGGRDGNERFFVGSPGEVASWGIHGSAVTSTAMPGVTQAAQSVSFTYNYDTGAWQYWVGTNLLSGSTSAGLDLDTLRIGADIDNVADINVSDVTVEITAIPEPSTYALLCLGAVGAGYLRWRQRRK